MACEQPIPGRRRRRTPRRRMRCAARLRALAMASCSTGPRPLSCSTPGARNPTRRENRAVHALSRLMLHGAIGSIQCSWVKLGDDLCRDVLVGGVNDLGGTLMEETISRMAGSENGSFKTISQLADMVAPIGRRLRQRTTTYGQPSAQRLAAASASDGFCASVRGLPGRPLPLISLPSAGF